MTVAELDELARVDWLYFGSCERLHAAVSATYDAEEWCALSVTLACGRSAVRAWIPGIFSRMTLPRCAHCCDRLGMPRGVGSPKNDDDCRRVLGLRPSWEATL